MSKHNAGDLIIVPPGTYFSEYHKGYDIPNFITVKESSPGVILESFADANVILINDGNCSNILIINNKTIKGNDDDK